MSSRPWIANGNLGTARNPNIDSLEGADVIVLTEAYRAHRALRRWCAKHRYRFFGYGRRKGGEAPGIAVLVREGHRVKHRRLLRMDEGWKGPFTGRRRDPRRFPVLVVRIRGEIWHVVGVHFPPASNGSGGSRIDGPNYSAYREAIAAVKAYAERCPRASLAVVGDFNMTSTLMRRYFGDWSLTSWGKVDHLIARNARPVRGIRRLRRRSTPGGHGFGRVRLRPTSRRNR